MLQGESFLLLQTSEGDGNSAICEKVLIKCYTSDVLIYRYFSGELQRKNQCIDYIKKCIGASIANNCDLILSLVKKDLLARILRFFFCKSQMLN
jgi:hypothetical protein